MSSQDRSLVICCFLLLICAFIFLNFRFYLFCNAFEHRNEISTVHSTCFSWVLRNVIIETNSKFLILDEISLLFKQDTER